MGDIRFGVWYYLYNKETKKTDIVYPFDAEDINMLGMSAGFVHYFTSEGKKGFAGSSYFEENSKIKEKSGEVPYYTPDGKTFSDFTDIISKQIEKIREDANEVWRIGYALENAGIKELGEKLVSRGRSLEKEAEKIKLAHQDYAVLRMESKKE